jgi:hypothetical protein
MEILLLTNMRRSLSVLLWISVPSQNSTLFTTKMPTFAKRTLLAVVAVVVPAVVEAAVVEAVVITLFRKVTVTFLMIPTNLTALR